MLDYYSEDNQQEATNKNKITHPLPPQFVFVFNNGPCSQDCFRRKNNNLLAGQEGVTHFTLSYKMTDIVLHTK